MPAERPAPETRTAFDVVCVGLGTRDTIVEVPTHPRPDGRLVVGPFTRADGGPAATAAVAAARLGARTAFVGAVPADPGGEALLAALAGEGIDVSGAERRPGSMPESIVLVDRAAGTRSIVHAPGVSLEDLSSVARAHLDDAAWVHVDHAGHLLVGGVARSRLSVDAGNPIPQLDLDGVGLYGPSRPALDALMGTGTLASGLRAALAAGVRRVAVTRGADGAVAAAAEGAWSVASLATGVVSTLGAGDVFHGAMVASMAAGHSLPDALRRATLAATLSCRALDGRSGAPTLDELEQLLPSAPRAEPFLLTEDP